MGGHEVARPLYVPRTEPVVQGVGHVVVALEPRRGAAMQVGDEARLATPELDLKPLAEEVVVAIPLATAVERHQEEIVTLDGPQHPCTVVTPRQDVAQLRAQPPHDGGPREKTDDVLGLIGQHLRRQVVGDLAPVARRRDAGTDRAARLPRQ